MSVTLELDREAREPWAVLGIRADGSNRIAVGGWGIAVDQVVRDYIADRLVRDGAVHGLDEEASRAEIQRAGAETGILCDDVVRFGAGRTLDAVLDKLPPQT